MTAAYQIAPARTAADIAAIAALFRAYAASLQIDLSYQGFDAEVADLPGKYAPPGGELLLARASDGSVLGCVALRPMDSAGSAEMKRLYVAPAGRGLGLGRALVEALVMCAAGLGYRDICLDTLPSMTDAIMLYRKLGFEPTEHYYDTPIEGTVFLRRSV